MSGLWYNQRALVQGPRLPVRQRQGALLAKIGIGQLLGFSAGRLLFAKIYACLNLCGGDVS